MVIELGKVTNSIAAVKEANAYPRKERIWQKVSTCVIHRIKVPDSSTAEGIWNFFTDPKYRTGGKMPYHFIIEEDGHVVQCVGLETVAPGALRLNGIGVQIGVVGDFRKAPPHPSQIFALIGLCARLSLAGAKELVGHTERSGASHNKNKVCPGKHLDMNMVRKTVKQRLAESALQDLQRMGVVI